MAFGSSSLARNLPPSLERWLNSLKQATPTDEQWLESEALD
jgi:hypothetical protein